MLRGLMMDRPLLVSSVIDYAAEIYPEVEIVSQTVEGGLHRYGYRASRERIGRLAAALQGLGIKPGDRVATLAWNGYRHFELYYAIAGIGGGLGEGLLQAHAQRVAQRVHRRVVHANDRHIALLLRFHDGHGLALLF